MIYDIRDLTQYELVLGLTMLYGPISHLEMTKIVKRDLSDGLTRAQGAGELHSMWIDGVAYYSFRSRSL